MQHDLAEKFEGKFDMSEKLTKIWRKNFRGGLEFFLKNNLRISHLMRSSCTLIYYTALGGA